MQRSRNFYFALKNGEFEDTLMTHHPGVTTCWLGSLSIWLTSQQGYSNSWFYSEHFMSPGMLARVRFPIAILSGVLTLMVGILLYRLFDALLAGIGTLFLLIEPFLISESRRAHTDVLTALFLFLALLLWLCYLEGETRKPRRDIVLSGICFGLACLTKSHAGVFLLTLPILLFWYVKQQKLSGDKVLKSGLLFCSTALLTVLCIWPYLWTFKLGNIPIFPFLLCGCVGMLLWSWRKLSTHDSFSRLEIFILCMGLFLSIGLAGFAATNVFDRMYAALINAHEFPKLFLGKVRYNPGPLFYPVMAFIWSAPLTVPLTILALYGAWQQRYQNKKIFRVTVVLIVFSLIYLIGLSLVAKKIDRYIIICLPAVSFLSTLGAIYIVQQLPKKGFRYLLLFAIIVLQVVPVLRLHPYYVTYHFPLISGKWISNNITFGGGVGIDVAGNYLNAKPDAENLNVRISWFSDNLNKYFVGNTWERNRKTLWSNIDLDYDIEYTRIRKIQETPIDLPPKHGVPPNVLLFRNTIPRELEHVVKLNGIDYVWIYRMIEPTNNTDALSE